jgi:hypothetical protein
MRSLSRKKKVLSTLKRKILKSISVLLHPVFRKRQKHNAAQEILCGG